MQGDSPPPRSLSESPVDPDFSLDFVQYSDGLLIRWKKAPAAASNAYFMNGFPVHC